MVVAHSLTGNRMIDRRSAFIGLGSVAHRLAARCPTTAASAGDPISHQQFAKVDDRLWFCGLLYGYVSRFCALDYLDESHGNRAS
jgi:hypothetical protein